MKVGYKLWVSSVSLKNAIHSGDSDICIDGVYGIWTQVLGTLSKIWTGSLHEGG